MTGNEVREAFLRFFEEKGHRVMPSFPLVLPEDPSTLFTVAGMQPFSPVFRGEAPAPAPTVATSQKVFREGDLDTVGTIGRYHTFYEMLGNFSFGDYFKRGAVEYAWGFCTGVLNLPASQLWFTVYEDDEETAGYWQEVAGCGPERVVRLGKEDNWWPQTAWNGPCGPCSEIYLDRGVEWGCGKPDCKPGCDCDRFLEFWNLVFQMYLQDASGRILSELPRFGIDTGMGLERVASLVMGVASNYETDLVLPVIVELMRVLREDEGLDIVYTPIRPPGREAPGVSGKLESDDQISARIRGVADHVRAACFLIADGVLPSGEGRGSVLRRLIRRSFGNGWRLGVENPFLYKCVPGVIRALGAAYPEIPERAEHIASTIRTEEEQFRTTVEAGMQLLQRTLDRQRASGTAVVDGDTAFTLATTHGFPSELTADVVAQYGFQVDWADFEKRMEDHREKSRDVGRVARGQFTPGLSRIRNESGPTRFLGYDAVAADAKTLALLESGEDVTRLEAGSEGVVALDQTPFYAESGGQVGDTGSLEWDGGMAEVLNTTRLNEIWLHRVRVSSGTLQAGQDVRALVDADRRSRVMRNHTATHLLHAALHRLLGHHATQSGSLVAPDRLRFDFTHPEPLTREQLTAVEQWVQQQINENIPILIQERGLDEARSLGAMALFGEKYGDRVRVVEVGDGNVSRELCGGIHVPTTGVIGLFHITSESGVGSGLRRIEAVTGPGAVAYYHERESILERLAGQLRCGPDEAPERVARLQQQVRDLQTQRDDLLRNSGRAEAQQAQQIGPVQAFIRRHDGLDADALGKMADQSVAGTPNAVVVLAAVRDGRVTFVAKASPGAVRLGVHAGNLVKSLATQCGGGGGGRQDFAQAGGRNAEAVDAALETVPTQIQAMTSAGSA